MITIALYKYVYSLKKNILKNKNNMGVDVYRTDALVSAIKFTPLIFIIIRLKVTIIFAP